MTEILWAHCNTCLGQRRHELLHRVVDDWSDDEIGFNGADIYEMLRCCGCARLTFRHQSWLSDDTDDHGERRITTVYYPPALSRREPDWLDQLKRTADAAAFQGVLAKLTGTAPEPADALVVAELLKEIYAALQNDSRRLAVMGIRALLEVVMVAKVGDQGAFGKNLAAFRAAGFASQSQVDVLTTVLEAGHATIHRAYNPSADTVKTLIDIAESVIEAVYVHPRQIAELKGQIPPRTT